MTICVVYLKDVSITEDDEEEEDADDEEEEVDDEEDTELADDETATDADDDDEVADDDEGCKVVVMDDVEDVDDDDDELVVAFLLLDFDADVDKDETLEASFRCRRCRRTRGNGDGSIHIDFHGGGPTTSLIWPTCTCD